MGVIFFFNNGEVPVSKTYELDKLEVKGTNAVEWKKEGVTKLDGTISVTLQPHESTLFYLSEKSLVGYKPEKITGQKYVQGTKYRVHGTEYCVV